MAILEAEDWAVTQAQADRMSPDAPDLVLSKRLHAVLGQVPTVLATTTVIASLTAVVLAVSAGNRLAWFWLGRSWR